MIKNNNDTAVLLVNLGTPATPNLWGVFKFLRAFLLDRRVIELPRVVWWLILHGIVLPLRTRKVLKLYQSIWTETGSPLQVWTERLVVNLEKKIKMQWGEEVLVYYAMTYGDPNIQHCLKTLVSKKIKRLLIVPLFPQFSSTTSGAIFDKVAEFFRKNRYIPTIHFIHEYASTEAYQMALVESILAHWQQHGKPERFLFSFHGIPTQYEKAGDPYPEQCRNLAKDLAIRLNLPPDFWALGFQSRFGFNAWVQPSIDSILQDWVSQGIQSVAVLSPSFSVDCLETLEELNIRTRSTFLQSGGKVFHYIPALNDSEGHTEVLSSLIGKFFFKKR